MFDQQQKSADETVYSTNKQRATFAKRDFIKKTHNPNQPHSVTSDGKFHIGLHEKKHCNTISTEHLQCCVQ